MTSRALQLLCVGVLVAALAPVASGPALSTAQQPAKPRPAPRTQPHGDHRTPAGWKFSWPKGDPAKGRAVFAKLECYSCHEVKGEKFPAPTDKGKIGPELSMMGPLHETGYFVEAIVNPSAVIEKGKGYHGPDGSSKMPSFNDSLNVQELIDLVAFLKALKPPAGAGAGHKGH
jgi:mono/diheme cytochrome c family protein